jgi:autotransporter-associated beta strand protein
MQRSFVFRPVVTGSRAASIFLGAIAALLTAGSASADIIYWYYGSDGSWSTRGQWEPLPLTIPVSTDTVHFNFAGQNTNATITLDADQAALGLVFDSTGTVTINSGDPTTSKLTVGSGGIIVSSSAGAATINAPVQLGSGVGAFNAAAGTVLTVNGNVTGAGINLQKTGAGTVNLNGNLWDPLDTPNVNLNVNAGTLNMTNSNVRTTGIFTNNSSAAGSNLTLTNATVYLDGSNNDWGSLVVGYNAGTGAHACNMHGGSLSTLYGGIVQAPSGGGVRSIATFDNDAAVNFVASVWFMGDNGGQHGSQTAVIRSGTVTCDMASNIQVGVVGGFNVFDQVGGTVTAPLVDGTNGWGHSHRAGISLQYRMSKPDCFGIYNLGSAATLITGAIASGDATTSAANNPAANNAYFNFHGGTLKPAVNNVDFIRTTLTGAFTALAAPQPIVYSENAIIDTDGKDITIQQPLRAPAGNGVSDTTITVSGANQGSGYNATPIIYVTTNPALEPSSGCSNGATAVANMADDGTGKGTYKIASITITNPGQNFTATPVLAAQGGSPVTAADLSSYTLTTAPNVSGGLTKNGLGTLTLGGVNTYTGNTSVTAGTLTLADNAQLKFGIGATSGVNNQISGEATVVLAGDFNIDTSLVDASALTTGTWVLENVSTLTGAYEGTFQVVSGTTPWEVTGDVWTKTVDTKTYTFDEATGTLTLSSASWTYADWAILKGIPGAPADGDSDDDGLANAVEMVVGGHPQNTIDTGLLPTLALVTDPAGVPAGNYLEFTYRRTHESVSASVTAACEYDTDLVPLWTTAVDGVDGVKVLEDVPYESYSAVVPTDRVRVYVPRTGGKLFGRMRVTVP